MISKLLSLFENFV